MSDPKECEHIDTYSWVIGARRLYWCRRCGAIAVADDVIGVDTVFTMPNKDDPPIGLA